MSGTQRYSRYEKARIIGARALQIAYGAPVLVETERTQPILIAAQEFDAGVLPFTVHRGEG
jgi:DNA-directed RNA polymerase subunit K